MDLIQQPKLFGLLFFMSYLMYLVAQILSLVVYKGSLTLRKEACDTPIKTGNLTVS